MSDNNNDQHAGMGGSYLLDVKTGARTLVERTDIEITISIPVPLAPAIAPPQVNSPAKPPAK